jgi:cytolysin-activating lysine-acyltransferase
MLSVDQPAARSDAAPKLNGAEARVANGVERKEATAAPNPPSPTADETRFAVTFTRIVSVLSRSPHYKHYALSDLEWLVVPPILTGQCAVMEAKVNGRQVPTAAAVWASVSEEVDKRLSENLTTPIKLRPDEWRCGEILWLVDAVGDPKAIPLLLRQLQGGPFKGREAKVRIFGPDARPTVSKLQSVTPP